VLDRGVSGEDAQFRASYAKTVIGTIKRQPEAVAARLLEAIGPERRAKVREYGMLGWMPATDFLELVAILGKELGAARARPFWCDCLDLSLNRRLLAPLRAGAIALHGRHPGALLRMTPQAWQLVSRGAGVCSVVESDATQITLQFRELPMAMRIAELIYLWEGGSMACVKQLGFTGSSEGRVPGPGAVDVTVRWTAPAAKAR
jgi:hypothetical protein